MPLRGALFREIQKLKAQRAKAEQNKFKREVVQEAKTLKKLRTQRIRQEGRSALKRQIAIEKARIQRAKKPLQKGKLESLLVKSLKKGLKARKKHIKIEFNPGGTKRRRKKK